MFNSDTYPLSNRCVIHTSFSICIKCNKKYLKHWVTIYIGSSIGTRNQLIMPWNIKNDP